jgi:CAAD domains of cyanobacterial aminoacyl-tRNA synthetase
MDSQLQSAEFASPDLGDQPYVESVETSDATSLATIPMDQSRRQTEQLQEFGLQVRLFLAHLPDYIGRFFAANRQPVITVGIIVASIIALKVLLAVLDALNDIPLLAPTLELVGIAYVVWFVNRYLLKASTRQEFSQNVQTWKQDLVGSYQLPEA